MSRLFKKENAVFASPACPPGFATKNVRVSLTHVGAAHAPELPLSRTSKVIVAVAPAGRRPAFTVTPNPLFNCGGFGPTSARAEPHGTSIVAERGEVTVSFTDKGCVLVVEKANTRNCWMPEISWLFAGLSQF